MADKIDVEIKLNNVGEAKPVNCMEVDGKTPKPINYHFEKLADGKYVINIQVPICAIPHIDSNNSGKYRTKTLNKKYTSNKYDLCITPKIDYEPKPGAPAHQIEKLTKMLFNLNMDIGGKKPPDAGDD